MIFAFVVFIFAANLTILSGPSEFWNRLRRQIRESIDRIDEYRGILHIRRHLAASPLFKGISHFRDTRIEMLRASTFNELDEVLAKIEKRINNEYSYE